MRYLFRAGWARAGRLLFWSALLPWAVAAPASLRAQSPAGIQAETVRIDGPIAGLKLGLRHVSAKGAKPAGPMVLILHGTNVPTSGNADYPFGGRSMMAALAESGLDAWGLDFYGFGTSDRYPQMNDPADRHPPLGQAPEAADQAAAAIAYLQRRNGGQRVMLIGDSGGSLVAGIFATQHPSSVSRLVLFGPVTPFAAGGGAGTPPAYRLVTPDQLWSRFTQWSTRAGPPDALDKNFYDAWAASLLASDPSSRTRMPPSIKIPNGRAADQVGIAAGHFPYDPGKILAPTLVVMGETDEVTTFPGAQWLLESLRNAPQRRLVVIGHASHTIQFEAERAQLYDVIAQFLNEGR